MSVFDDLLGSSEGEKYKHLGTLYIDDEKRIDFITELTKKEIALITQIDYEEEFILEEFGIKIGYKKVTHGFKKKMVSFDRKGRTESIDVMKADNPEAKKNSRIANFLGLK